MRTQLLRVGLLATCIVVTACYIRAGQRVETSSLANSPRGVALSLQLASKRVDDAELLEASDSGLLVLHGGVIARVPYRSITSLNFELSQYFLQPNSTPSPGLMRQLRLLSRFPQGVSPEILATLLASVGQSDVRLLEQ